MAEAKFDEAFYITLKHEGGYVNDPDDRGGETYMGIARKFHDDWSGWECIDSYEDKSNLKNDSTLHELVKEFYLEKFWNVSNLGDLQQDISNKLFDVGVNQGVGTAGKYLQKALNMLNNNQKYYNNIKVDGKVGSGTVSAFRTYLGKCNSMSSRSIKEGISVLLDIIKGEQYMRYRNIVTKSEGQEKYFYGWVKRIKG